MGESEFRERTFEHPVLRELDGCGRTVYQPDQVLEHAIGFDAAVRTHNVLFWTVIGKRAPRGRLIDTKWWPAFPPSPVPNRLLNAFLQFKCPQRLAFPTAGEWGHWRTPYFRFRMEPVQQEALTACAKGLGRQGVVVYAAPAFHKMAELDDFQRRGTVVANSHFVEVDRVAGHERYTYINARDKGWAHSDPVEVEPFQWAEQLPDRLATVLDRASGDVIRQAHAVLSEAVRASPLRATFDNLAKGVEQALTPLYAELRDGAPIISNYAQALVAVELLDSEWVTIGNEQPATRPVKQSFQPGRMVDID